MTEDSRYAIVPKGLRHRPVVPLRTAVLMLERAGVVATGD